MNRSGQDRAGALPAAAGPEFPPVCQATLDWAEVEALLRDIGACTELDEIVPKWRAGERVAEAGAGGVSLSEAGRLLAGRAVCGVQFRYRHDGAHWWDTVLVVPGGWRIVRVRHEFGDPAGGV